MTEKSSIVVLGVTDLNKEETDLFEEIGRAIYHSNRQLITTQSKGVGKAVSDGFRDSGGKPIWLANKEVPDHDRVLIFGDNAFQSKLDEAVPDWQDRGWLSVHRNDFFEFWKMLVEYIANRTRSKSGDG